jgi:Glu-tRNA(Gln) amidotransferase subunit E-like FAD-binding protein
MQAFSGDLLERLAADPLLLGQLLWVLCREQAQEKKVSEEDFGRLAGDGIEHATEGLLEALADFFPTRKRSALKVWMAKMKRMEGMAVDAAVKDMESGRMETLLEKILTGSGDSATSSGPSSDSTRVPSASAGS